MFAPIFLHITIRRSAMVTVLTRSTYTLYVTLYTVTHSPTDHCPKKPSLLLLIRIILCTYFFVSINYLILEENKVVIKHNNDCHKTFLTMFDETYKSCKHGILIHLIQLTFTLPFPVYCICVGLCIIYGYVILYICIYIYNYMNV